MKFKNLPPKVKRTPEQNAIGAFKAGSPINSLHIVLEDMTLDQMVDFFIHALKITKFKAYKLGLQNLEDAISIYRATHDSYLLTKAKKSFEGSDYFNSICTGILTLVSSPEMKKDTAWVAVIPCMIYEISYGEDMGKHLIADILSFRYDNKSFGLLYAN